MRTDRRIKDVKLAAPPPLSGSTQPAGTCNILREYELIRKPEAFATKCAAASPLGNSRRYILASALQTLSTSAAAFSPGRSRTPVAGETFSQQRLRNRPSAGSPDSPRALPPRSRPDSVLGRSSRWRHGGNFRNRAGVLPFLPITGGGKGETEVEDCVPVPSATGDYGASEGEGVSSFQPQGEMKNSRCGDL